MRRAGEGAHEGVCVAFSTSACHAQLDFAQVRPCMMDSLYTVSFVLVSGDIDGDMGTCKRPCLDTYKYCIQSDTKLHHYSID